MRQKICVSAASKLASAAPQKIRAVLGLDGFVDAIIHVVDKRHSASSFDRMQTIAEFSNRIGAAAGQSSNYEFVVTLQKLGGNGPIMANALAAAGFPVTYVGSLGYPAIHPVFEEMGKHADLLSLSEPAYTDAVEFNDGKLMLGKHRALAEVNWENLRARVGEDTFTHLLDEAQLIGLVNWTMLPHMTSIWNHLLEEVLPGLSRKPRRLFVDLADPEKRTRADLLAALATLTKFQSYLEVTLGLNLKESAQVAHVLGLPQPAHAEAALESTAAAIRQKLNISTVVIHPRKGAAAANGHGTASFAGPFVTEPKISTGAGDHFNAGFVTGQVLGLDLAESLALGCATSGYYVRHAASPTASQLAAFVRDLPPGQE
ncbi:MAG: carbohydrate kinase family protein [Phycisphaerae bacterium]